jgi:hypothetical protein
VTIAGMRKPGAFSRSTSGRRPGRYPSRPGIRHRFEEAAPPAYRPLAKKGYLGAPALPAAMAVFRRHIDPVINRSIFEDSAPTLVD